MKIARTIAQNEKRKLKGFTLIELLVIIAIIAILAAILFPVFGRARENARRSSCQSNMKQIGLGILQYSQDYDEIMVPVERGTAGTDAWHMLLQPYLKSEQIFACPSSQNAAHVRSSAARPFAHYLGNGNDALDTSPSSPFQYRRPMDLTDYTNANTVQPTAMSQITSPAQCILVHEQSNVNWSRPFAATTTNIEFTNHLATTTFLFADGHVKSIKPTQTLVPGSLNMWAVDSIQGNNSNTLRNGLAAQEALMMK